MYPNDLWPPLELVEAALDTDKSSLFEDAGSQTGTFEKPNSRHTAELIHPLTELVQRRAAVAAKAFTPEWRPGRLVQVASNGFFVGILLDTFVQGQLILITVLGILLQLLQILELLLPVLCSL